MDITLLIAECRGAIAMNGDLPVHLPEDLEWFKEYTMDKVVVMGRTTVQSLPKKLEGRTVICLSSDPDYTSEKCDMTLTSREDIYQYCVGEELEELVIAGGGQVYEEFLEDANKVVKTRINHTLIPKGKFDKCRDVLMGPDLSRKGEFTSAEVLLKNPKMVVIEYVWGDEEHA